ncbi:MAG: flippase [Nitrospirota bacterium]
MENSQSSFARSQDLFTLAKGTVISFSGEIVHIIITYAYGIIIARFMGLSDFGVFFLGITIFNLITLFSLCGIEDGLMRFIGFHVQNKEVGKAKGLIRFSLYSAIVSGTAFGALCFFFADLIALNIFRKPELATVLRFLSIGIPISAVMTVTVASIRGFKNVVPYVFIRKVFMPLISIILSLIVIFMGGHLIGLSVTYVGAMACAALLGFFMLRSFLSSFEEGPVKRSSYEQYLPFITTAFLVNTFLFIFAWCDLIILGILRSTGEVGVYFAAKKTALSLNLLLISLNSIFTPLISHLYSGNARDHLHDAFKTSTQWILIFGLPIFLVILFTSKELLSLFGAAFVEGQTCLIILALGQLFNLSAGSVGYLLMMTGYQRLMLVNVIVLVIIAIPLSVVLVSRYGILGAAYANASSIIIANILALAEVNILLRLNPFNMRYVRILLAGVITAVSLYGLNMILPGNQPLFTVMVETASILILFFALVLLFGITESEKRILISIRQKINCSLWRGIPGTRDNG